MLAFEDATDKGWDDGEFAGTNDMGGIVHRLDQSGTQTDIDAVQEISTLRNAVVLIGAATHINLSHITSDDTVDSQFVVIDRHAPETGEIVGNTIGNVGKGKIFGQRLTTLHDGIDSPIEGAVATHHHNDAVAVLTHHLCQALHRVRSLGLQKVILHTLLLHVLLNQLPSFSRLIKA